MSSQQGENKKKGSAWWTSLIKVAVLALVIYFLNQKLDFKDVLQRLGEIPKAPLLGAFAVFTISKLIGTIRLKAFLRAIQIDIGIWENIKLFYTGAFLNFGLPGSVGGDGYKALYLQRVYKGGVKASVSSVFLDRLSGVVALAFIAGIMTFLVDRSGMPDIILYGAIAVVALCYPVYYLVLKLLFPKFLDAFWSTNVLSLVVQGLQVVCVWLILTAAGVNEHLWVYLTVFMVSSVFAVIPISFAGAGMRESVFVFAADFLPINQELGVAAMFIYFLITMASSAVGVYFFIAEKMSGKTEE